LNVPTEIFQEVDKILKYRVCDGEEQYLVRWKKQPAEHNSWLRRSDFVDYGPILAYDKKYGKKRNRSLKGTDDAVVDPDTDVVMHNDDDKQQDSDENQAPIEASGEQETRENVDNSAIRKEQISEISTGFVLFIVL